MCRHLGGNSNPPLPLSIEQSIRAPHSPAVCLRGRGPLSHTLAAPADASGHRGAQEGCCASALRRGKTPRSALSLPPESSTQGLSFHSQTPHQDLWPEPLAVPPPPPRESRKRCSSSQCLQRHRCPTASCTTSLRCCRHPPSYLRRVPSAPQGKGAWSESQRSESRAPTLLLLPPPADGHPTSPSGPGKRGYSHQKPWDTVTQSPASHRVKTTLARGPDGSAMPASWHPLFRLMTWALLKSCCQG